MSREKQTSKKSTGGKQLTEEHWAPRPQATFPARSSRTSRQICAFKAPLWLRSKRPVKPTWLVSSKFCALHAKMVTIMPAFFEAKLDKFNLM